MDSHQLSKIFRPLARGYIHQVAFFVALCASIYLLSQSHGKLAIIANSIYCLSITGLYTVSALYHCRIWSRPSYLFLRKIDHAAIFALIAGSATPVCLLGLKGALGFKLFYTMWLLAAIGMIIAIFWTHAPKWVRASMYVAIGWYAVPYLPEIKSSLGTTDLHLLIAGGIIYTVGALCYALKWPNLFPRVFGYHELFHVFVVVASACHFMVIYHLTTLPHA